MRIEWLLALVQYGGRPVAQYGAVWWLLYCRTVAPTGRDVQGLTASRHSILQETQVNGRLLAGLWDTWQLGYRGVSQIPPIPGLQNLRFPPQNIYKSYPNSAMGGKSCPKLGCPAPCSLLFAGQCPLTLSVIFFYMFWFTPFVDAKW